VGRAYVYCVHSGQASVVIWLHGHDASKCFLYDHWKRHWKLSTRYCSCCIGHGRLIECIVIRHRADGLFPAWILTPKRSVCHACVSERRPILDLWDLCDLVFLGRFCVLFCFGSSVLVRQSLPFLFRFSASVVWSKLLDNRQPTMINRTGDLQSPCSLLAPFAMN
jgi:hypothetical protein